VVSASDFEHTSNGSLQEGIAHTEKVVTQDMADVRMLTPLQAFKTEVLPRSKLERIFLTQGAF